MALNRSAQVAASLFAAAEAETFVPACIAEQCSAEIASLAKDDYSHSVINCTMQNFGPCAGKAWECLGDSSCRSVVTCAPNVFKTCKADIWKMVTDPDEREKIMCMGQCLDNGKLNPLCVAAKCGKAAVECLADETCRDAALCLPKATLACSKPAFDCIIGTDKVCSENIKCLGHGVSQCGAPAVNWLTDSRIADVITCAGSKCPHPAGDTHSAQEGHAEIVASAQPGNVAEQLLCVAEKCSAKVLKVFTDDDTKGLLQCALKADIVNTCSSVWRCLGDSKCSEALSCWSKPFETCDGDMWKVLTVEAERNRIVSGATCLRNCEEAHKDDFVQAAFCVLDKCSQGVLDCYHDPVCKAGVQCLPNTVGQCMMPQLDAYVHQDLFRNSTKCVGKGLEVCGRGAIEMLRDQNIAEAVQCASQCTRTQPLTSNVVVV